MDDTTTGGTPSTPPTLQDLLTQFQADDAAVQTALKNGAALIQQLEGQPVDPAIIAGFIQVHNDLVGALSNWSSTTGGTGSSPTTSGDTTGSGSASSTNP